MELVIVLRRLARPYAMVYSDSTLLFRASGETTMRLLEHAVKVSKDVRVEEHGVERIYHVNGEMAPVVASLLLLARRSRTGDKWHKVIDLVAAGKAPGLPEALEKMLEAAIEASKRYPQEPRKYKTAINPKVADAVTSGMKRFVEKYMKTLSIQL